VQLEDALAVSDEVSYALLHPGQVWVELVPADVVVAYQEAMPVIQDAEISDRGLGS